MHLSCPFCGCQNESEPLANDHPEEPYDDIWDSSSWMKNAFFMMLNPFQNTYVHYLGSNTQPKKSRKADQKISVFFDALPLQRHMYTPIHSILSKATAAAAVGKMELARTHGTEIPEGWALDK